MLLIVGYERNMIERLRAALRKQGYPSFGITLRGLSSFSYGYYVTSILFATPASRSRTEYAISSLRSYFPNAPIALCATESFSEEEAAACQKIAFVLPEKIRSPRMIRLLNEREFLYPEEAFSRGVYRHKLCDAPLFYGRPFPVSLTAMEYTFLSLLLLNPAGVSWELIRSTCFNLLNPTTANTVSAMISRFNKKMAPFMLHKFVVYDKTDGYRLF